MKLAAIASTFIEAGRDTLNFAVPATGNTPSTWPVLSIFTRYASSRPFTSETESLPTFRSVIQSIASAPR
jgi:hypothetical protein